MGQQAGAQGRVDAAVLRPKSARQASRLETQAGIPYCGLETKFLLLQEASVLNIKPSTDCLRLTYITKNNLVYSESTGLNIDHI